MTKYKYTGNNPVGVPGIGEVKPNQIIETDIKINNSNFIKVEEENKNRESRPDFARNNKPTGIKNK